MKKSISDHEVGIQSHQDREPDYWAQAVMENGDVVVSESVRMAHELTGWKSFIEQKLNQKVVNLLPRKRVYSEGSFHDESITVDENPVVPMPDEIRELLHQLNQPRKHLLAEDLGELEIDGVPWETYLYHARINDDFSHAWARVKAAHYGG